RTLFIPNGVSLRPPSRGGDVHAELGLERGVPVIGTVGGLRPQKAHQVLLRAVSLLPDQLRAVRVLIVGEGPERGALERLAAELGVQERVRFVGSRTDVPNILAALDVAVCCSDFEGSPLSVLEYMDAGLPVVASAVGGLPDLIEPGVHGLLVPPQDPIALGEALAELIREPERAREMGARGRGRRRAEFDIDV